MLDAMSPAAVRIRLAEIRKERGLTQKELAKLVGIHELTISRIEGGSRQIELDTLGKLCSALQVPIQELVVVIPEADELSQ